MNVHILQLLSQSLPMPRIHARRTLAQWAIWRSLKYMHESNPPAYMYQAETMQKQRN